MRSKESHHPGNTRRAGGGHQLIGTIASAAAVLLLLYSLASYTGAQQHSHSKQLRTGSRSGSSLEKQLVAELSSGPDGQLLQKYILPMIDAKGLSTAQLPLLLQGTNLSALSTADVLDKAAGSSPDSQLHWQLAGLHQQLLCKSGLTAARKPPNSVLADMGNYSMYVYASNDFVSKELAGPRHSYEAVEVAAVLWAMQQHAAAQQRTGRAVPVASQPLFVDGGANVGSFAFAVADAGYRVAAFEGMPSNIALLRHTLCSNPRLTERVALFGTGLGAQADTCYVVSDQINVGDGHTVCGEEEVRKRTDNTGYTIRGKTSVRLLDSILAEDVQVMKLDVEGFELQVLQGAERLLTKHRVNYILAACTFGGAPRQRQILQLLDKHGYYISLESFKGPWLDPAAVANGTSRLPWVNIYCARKDLSTVVPPAKPARL